MIPRSTNGLSKSQLAASVEFAESDAVSDHDDRFSRSAVVMQQPSSREWPRRALLPLVLTLAVVILVAFVANLGLDTPDPGPFPTRVCRSGVTGKPGGRHQCSRHPPSRPWQAQRVQQVRNRATAPPSILLDDLPIVRVPLAAPPRPTSNLCHPPLLSPNQVLWRFRRPRHRHGRRPDVCSSVRVRRVRWWT